MKLSNSFFVLCCLAVTGAVPNLSHQRRHPGTSLVDNDSGFYEGCGGQIILTNTSNPIIEYSTALHFDQNQGHCLWSLEAAPGLTIKSLIFHVEYFATPRYDVSFMDRNYQTFGMDFGYPSYQEEVMYRFNTTQGYLKIDETVFENDAKIRLSLTTIFEKEAVEPDFDLFWLNTLDCPFSLNFEYLPPYSNNEKIIFFQPIHNDEQPPTGPTSIRVQYESSVVSNRDTLDMYTWSNTDVVTYRSLGGRFNTASFHVNTSQTYPEIVRFRGSSGHKLQFDLRCE